MRTNRTDEGHDGNRRTDTFRDAGRPSRPTTDTDRELEPEYRLFMSRSIDWDRIRRAADVAKRTGKGLARRVIDSRAGDFIRKKLPKLGPEPPQETPAKPAQAKGRTMSHKMSRQEYETQRSRYIALCSGNRAAEEQAELERSARQLQLEIQRCQRETLEAARADIAAMAKEGKGKPPGLSRKQALEMATRIRDHADVSSFKVEFSDRARTIRVRTEDIVIELDGHRHNAGKFEILIHDDGSKGVAQIFRLTGGRNGQGQEERQPLPLHESLVRGLPEIVAAHRYDAAVLNCIAWTRKHLQQRLQSKRKKATRRREGR